MTPATVYDSREWRRLERERHGLLEAAFRQPCIFTADQGRALRRVRDRQAVLERYERDMPRARALASMLNEYLPLSESNTPVHRWRL